MVNLDSAMPQTVSNPPRVRKGTVNQKASKHMGMVNGTALVDSSPLVNRHTPVKTRNPVTTNSCSRGPGNGRPTVGGAPAVTADSHAPQVGGRRDRWRHGPRNKYRKWRSKPPPLPVRDSEDWEKELLDSVGSVSRQEEPYDPEDVSLQGLTFGHTVPPALPATTDYNPASYHPPPIKWVRHVGLTVDGQFDEAED